MNLHFKWLILLLDVCPVLREVLSINYHNNRKDILKESSSQQFTFESAKMYNNGFPMSAVMDYSFLMNTKPCRHEEKENVFSLLKYQSYMAHLRSKPLCQVSKLDSHRNNSKVILI